MIQRPDNQPCFPLSFFFFFFRKSKGLQLIPSGIYPCGSAGKESSCNAGDLAQIPELGRSPGEGKGFPLQYSGLGNSITGKSMNRGAWQAAVHGVTKSRSQLSDFTFPFYFHALEKEMATHSNILAQRIPGTGEPGWLLSMGSHRVGHD